MADLSTAEDLLSARRSVVEANPGSFMISPAEAQAQATDLREIAARRGTKDTKKGDEGGKAGDSGVQPQFGKDELLAEAYRRGILSPEKKAAYEEAQRRGLVKQKTDDGKEIAPDPRNPNRVIITDTKTGESVTMTKPELKFGESVRKLLGPEHGPLPDVDYDSGTDWVDKVALDQADNEKEKRLYLDQRYGKANVQQDPNGIFYVIKGGKKVAPGGGGFMARFSADVVAEGPVFAGATGGAVLGGGLGGPPGAAGGAAIGGALGKETIETSKRLRGVSSKTPGEEAAAVGRAGLEMGGSELGGQAISRAVGRMTAGAVPAKASGTTPETRRLSAITTEGGAAPPIRSALPDMRVTQFHQALGEKLAGSMIETKNLSYIEQEMHALLKSAGFEDHEIPAAMAEILNPSAALSTADLGKELGTNVQLYTKGLQTAADAARDSAENTLERQLAQIKVLVKERKAAGDLAPDVADAIMTARKEFSRSMQRIYGRIDDLVGDQPVVPTFLAKRQAKAIVDKLPESDIKRIIKEIADLQSHETFENMQRLRSRLYELGEPADLAASGVLKRDLRNLRTAVDRSFDQAFLSTPSGKIIHPAAERAAKILRKADEMYAEGIVKFHDETLNQIVDAVKAGKPADPKVIAKELLKGGSAARIDTFKNLLGHDLWDRVVAQDFRDMLERTSEKGQTDTMSFFREVMKRKRAGTLNAAYGDKTAAEIENFARRQAVLSEKMPVDALTTGDSFRTAVEAATHAQENLDKFVEEHYLGELSDPSVEPELIYTTIIKPGHETLLERVFDHFGRDSEQVKAIRQTAMKVLLKGAIINTETGAGRTVGSDALRDALKRMTPKQQELLFPDGLADDLNLVADEAQFLFPKGGGEQVAGFVAGAIKTALPFGAVAGGMGFGARSGELALTAYGWGVALSWILSKPATVRWLANGIKSRDTVVRQMTDETFRGIVRAGMLGMLPGQQPND